MHSHKHIHTQIHSSHKIAAHTGIQKQSLDELIDGGGLDLQTVLGQHQVHARVLGILQSAREYKAAYMHSIKSIK